MPGEMGCRIAEAMRLFFMQINDGLAQMMVQQISK